MSTKTRTRNNHTAGRLRAVPESTPTPSATGHTETAAKLWQALCANPNSAAADLAGVAGIGKSTAGKILATWAKQGSAIRTPGITEGGRRAADLWAIANGHTDETVTSEVRSDSTDAKATSADTDEETTDTPDATTAQTDATNEESTNTATADTTEPTLADPASDNATEQPVPATDSGTREKALRLAPGALRGMVEDYLRDHPGEQFSPNAIGKTLNRSSGAVNNALEKLVAEGTAVKTQEAPKRFALAPTEQEAATDSAP